MKKYPLIILLAAITIFLSGCLENESKNLSPNKIKKNENPAKINITAKSDRTVYSSYEKIILDINITSDKELDDILVSAKGISAFGKNYFDKNQSISFTKQKNQNIRLIETLPSCNSCSGLRPGNYKINILVTNQGEILNQSSINVTIKQ